VDNKLFKEFPEVSTIAWEKIIQDDLKGADYEKKLIWKTNEGISVKPYYRIQDIENLQLLAVNPGEFPYIRGVKTANNRWQIRQDVTAKNLKEANHMALDAINKGATSICFTNINIKTPKDIASLLDNIDVQKTDIQFITKHSISLLHSLLLDFSIEKKIDPAKITGSIDFDFLGHLTVSGDYFVSDKKDLQELTETVRSAIAKSPNFRLISVNGSIFQNSGSTVVQELAYSLAIANEYMVMLTGNGITADQASASIQFNFAIGSNFFFEIAKIRSFRILWAKIAETHKVSANIARAYMHSSTTDWNKTLYDPHVNILRATTEAMSAVIGGTDSLSIKPYNSCSQEANAFSERIARNIQIILKEEAGFEKVADPSAGSYYIECLTDSIANEAWKIFLHVEKEGGYIASLKKGIIQEDIEKVADKRLYDISIRREILLGTNQYPNSGEKKLKEIDTNVYGVKQETSSNPVVKPLKQIRGAMAFEELRLLTEKNKKRPKVFMLTIGSASRRLARSQFSCNFFACAGFEVIDNAGFKTIDEGIAAATKAKSDIVVLCTSDDECPQYAPELYSKLDKKFIMVVAGNPPVMEELKKTGMENFISIKSNLLESLRKYQQMLGID
jgi:methylmalonyl-CoA mutase